MTIEISNNLFWEKLLRYSVVFGGFLLHLTIGNVYTYGNMGEYIVNYTNYRNTTYVNDGSAVWIFSLAIFGLGSSISFGGMLQRIFMTRRLVLISSWLMSLTVISMYWLLKTYLAVMVFVYGFLSGVLSGIVYGIAIGTACEWFPTAQGAVSGFIVSGFGLSAFIFDFIQSVYIKSHPNNYEAIPQSFILVGGILVVIQFVGALLLRKKAEIKDLTDASQLLIREENTTDEFISFSTIHESRVRPVNRKEIRPHLILLELDFWIMWLTFVLLTSCFIMVISLHKNFGKNVLNLDDTTYFLTTSAAVGAVCNALGRIFWGCVIDRYRYKIVMVILSFSLCTFLLTFYFIQFVPQDQVVLIKTLYMIWVMFLYFIPSGMFSIFPKMCSHLFGGNYFVGNYGLLFTGYSIGGLITSSITTIIWNRESSVYMHAFISGAAMAFLAGLITFRFRGHSLLNQNSLI